MFQEKKMSYNYYVRSSSGKKEIKSVHGLQKSKGV